MKQPQQKCCISPAVDVNKDVEETVNAENLDYFAHHYAQGAMGLILQTVAMPTVIFRYISISSNLVHD